MILVWKGAQKEGVSGGAKEGLFSFGAVSVLPLSSDHPAGRTDVW